MTFDHEHVPDRAHPGARRRGRRRCCPGADALLYAQDKRAMRERLAALGAPVPRWRRSASRRRRRARSRAEAGWPVVVKAARGGYDGRGVWMLADRGRGRRRWSHRHRADRRGAGPAAAGAGRGGGPVAVRAGRGLAGRGDRAAGRHLRRGDRAGARAVRGARGRGAAAGHRSPPSSAWSACSPSSCSRPTDGICVNELAMRPHNSGHWTIEGARTSQFEQHLRAVLDYPLGDTSLAAPAVVMANVLGGEPGGIVDRRAAAPPVRRRPAASRCTCTASRSGPAARSAT